jgi:lipopolysaccharide/colanic/teichoic acid biosynthesis glycosyltransferase
MSNPNQVIEPAINCVGREDRSQRENRAQIKTETVSAPIPSWKRMLDVTLIVMSLPFLVPVGVIVFVFVKIASPGPAFFRQQRVGHMRRKFMCLKFRTMRVNADTVVHQEHLQQLMKTNQPTRKLDCAGDKRLIFGGMWLRAAGVDELPQLFNVLRGDMSLVGPRPCTPFEFELFSERYKQRCEAPPGLTGLWQVSGKNKTTFEEMIDLDLKYVREKSLGLDLKIIGLTVPAIMKLIWEMKLRPKLGMRPVEMAVKTNTELPRKAAGPLPGTVSARD